MHNSHNHNTRCFSIVVLSNIVSSTSDIDVYCFPSCIIVLMQFRSQASCVRVRVTRDGVIVYTVGAYNFITVSLSVVCAPFRRSVTLTTMYIAKQRRSVLDASSTIINFFMDRLSTDQPQMLPVESRSFESRLSDPTSSNHMTCLDNSHNLNTRCFSIALSCVRSWSSCFHVRVTRDGVTVYTAAVKRTVWK